MTTKPRRRIVMTASIEADSWDELYSHLRNITTEMACDPSRQLSRSSVSGGYGSGHVLTIDVDETISHESWERDLNAYLEDLKA